MLTAKNNYKISGTQIQGMFIRQMKESAYYARGWNKAIRDRDENREDTFCRLLNLEKAELYALLEIQGLERGSEEFSMVIGYVLDLIHYMA